MQDYCAGESSSFKCNEKPERSVAFKVLCTAPGISRQSLGAKELGYAGEGGGPLSAALLIYTLKEGLIADSSLL